LHANNVYAYNLPIMKTPPQDRQTLTASLLQAGRQWRRLAEQRLAVHGISEARAAVLIWIGRLGGGVRQITLAGYIGIESTSLVRLLDQLGEAGLLERRDDPEDRRAKTIWLTRDGERLVALIEDELTGLRKQVLGKLPAEDIKATLRVFEAIQRASEETADDSDADSTR
tara:strand:- start:7059 stop:7568 length:510 start_codon:yes stop_codon:yes gene_type:complete